MPDSVAPIKGNGITLTIDDVQVTVPAGTLVVDAARVAGIEIPVFCSHPKLDPLGACRMCLVEFVGPRGSRLDTACTVRVSDGMVVRTDTEQVKSVREAVLGFILVNHPLDCPICDKGGECPLQDQTMEYGPGVSRLVEPKRHKQKHYPISDLIMLDQERCILCWRCIRYLEEWEDKPQLGLFERGGETAIDVFPGHSVDAKTSGSIIDICPVGALTNRVARFQYRPWEVKKTPSICTQCAVGCNLRLDERSHTLRRIVARENPAVNETWICDKGRFAHQFVDHADRLKTPLIRRDGKLGEATWDEALDYVVERLSALRNSKGAAAIGGITSGQISNEGAYLFQKFFRAIVGANNLDFRAGSAVRALPTGLPALSDIGKHDLILLAGFDPSESAPVLDLLVKRAVRRSGAKLLVIDSRKIEATRYTNAAGGDKGIFLGVRPGGEAVLLSGLTAAVLAARQDAAKKRGTLAGSATDEWGWLRNAGPEKVTAATGVVQRDVSAAAELLNGATNPLFIFGTGFAMGERGKEAVTALSNLAIALGHGDKLSYVGCEANSQGLRDVGCLPDMLPGHQSVADATVRDRLGKLWGVQPPAEPGLAYAQMTAGKVHGLVVIADDPARQPDLKKALRELDLLVVIDMFATETAELADVVLPLASFAESDATYTNLERRVQRAPAGIRAIGESRADWQIINGIAGRWLATQSEGEDEEASPDWKKKRRKVKGTAGAKPWNYPSVGAVLEEIGKAAPIYSTIRWETLGEAGIQWPAGQLARPARRSEAVNLSVSAPAPATGYRLVTGPLLWDDSLSLRFAAGQVCALAPRPFVALHPDDFASVGVGEGTVVTVSSTRGVVELVLKSDASVQRGTAWIPTGFAGLPAEQLGGGRGEVVAVTITARSGE